jgi:hypothetical protein
VSDRPFQKVDDDVKAHRRKVAEARRSARLAVACEACYATFEDIASEQARLKQEFLDRHERRTTA